MRRRILFPLFILPVICHAQMLNKNAAARSPEVQVYKVSALQAEHFIQTDSIPVDMFFTPDPDYIFGADTAYKAALPAGNYVFIYADDNRIAADLISKSNLFIYTINNGKRVQVEVRDSNENYIDNAKVFAGRKPANYNAGAHNYIIQQKDPGNILIKVYTPADTAFTEIESKEDQYTSTAMQHWKNIKKTAVVRTANWLPSKITGIFQHKAKYNSYGTTGRGYTLFNQPKYKLTDTVKLKSFIVTKKGKPLRKPLDLFLKEKNYDNKKQWLGRISPVSPGSYIYSFPLSDTLVYDTYYTTSFENNKHQRILSANFKTEDYLPDEITAYNIRSDKTEYKYGDSIKIFVSAKDANGLPLLDGKVQLTMTVHEADAIFCDSLYMTDTLYTEIKPLEPEGETLFSVSSGQFKNFTASIQAEVNFINSNQERQSRRLSFIYNSKLSSLKTRIKGDTLYADNYSPAGSDSVQGLLIISRDTDEAKHFTFPLRLKVDPFAYKYKIFQLQASSIIDSSIISPKEKYSLVLERISKGDTLGFMLTNPYRVPVNYTVFDGNKIIATGKSSGEKIQWQQKQHNKRRILRVKWQYYWNAEERSDEERIALLYKLLKIDVQSSAYVYPGQKDSIEIDVQNYNGKPAAGVNLAAVSYNSQLAKDIQVNEPPYLQRYHARPFVTRNGYEYSDINIKRRYPLGRHIAWLHKLGLDTMQYYQMLFPQRGVTDYVSPILSFLPQVSVHVTRNGERQEIYMLYINRRLVYYNDITDSMQYAFPSTEGYTQVSIRLRDSLITIDSIYTQPNYKHDIIIDPDKLAGSNIQREAKPVYLTPDERQLLETSLWQLDYNNATNKGYVWQGWRLTRINSNGKHIVGPFNAWDSLHFFAPSNFDIHFRFEDGYEYNLSEKILRLEKKRIFPEKMKELVLPLKVNPRWVIGDTLKDHPEIIYPKFVSDEMYLSVPKMSSHNFYAQQINEKGRLRLINKTDSAWKYIVLYQFKDSALWIIQDKSSYYSVKNIDPGIYQLLFITPKGFAAQMNVEIKSNNILYVKPAGLLYSKNNTTLSRLLDFQKEEARKYLNMKPVFEKDIPAGDFTDTIIFNGPNTLSGSIKDRNSGLPIPFATVALQGSRRRVVSGTDGTYMISQLNNGTYSITVSAVGYASETRVIELNKDYPLSVLFELTPARSSLSDVVVTSVGYATARKNLSYSVSKVRADGLTGIIQQTALSGKVAGINITGEVYNADTSIHIRGIRSSYASPAPLYVIDGILYDEMPGNISPGMIVSIEVLSGTEATVLYGNRADQGAIIITTQNKKSRTVFRDYAFWQPELITDKNGKVKFEITYPDNINGWQTYVLAMDRHKRIGRSVSFTAAYKPVMAQLSMPRFLIADDSAILTGKLLNYTNDDYPLTASYMINEREASSQKINLTAKSSSILQLPIAASTGTDSISAAFYLNTSTGFKDGEEKKIPVLRKGISETDGIFLILNKDTSFKYTVPQNTDEITLYAENKTIQVMLDELDYLKQYPWYCAEQTASKLKGLLMEKNIREQLNEKFNGDNDIKILTEKLIKSQAFDGGWGWWPDSHPNIFITGYVLQALAPLRNDKTVENTLRNGYLFLQNSLQLCGKDELLHVLGVLSAAGHVMDYKPWLESINPDSLNICQRWQLVAIKQSLGMKYNNEMETLCRAGIPTMTGGLHWGNENYRWYSNSTAVTAVAYKVLSYSGKYADTLPRIQQYFLETRQAAGHWRNTAESAMILDAILPSLLKSNSNFIQPAALQISGDTGFIISAFPSKIKLNTGQTKMLQLSKTGGGLTYLTIYRHQWNINPVPDTGRFSIHTYFSKNNQQLLSLPYGEKMEMAADIDVKADAEFVMIEIPIPAGCTYSAKPQPSYNMHYEYLKDRVVIFAERLSKGNYHFSINLEARYAGTYTLNPAKAELMYFPTLYGRNEMKKVKIE